jgi:hypothetical protein
MSVMSLRGTLPHYTSSAGEYKRSFVQHFCDVDNYGVLFKESTLAEHRSVHVWSMQLWGTWRNPKISFFVII